MQIVGRSEAPYAGGVETIDVWYSQRRGMWCVERLDGTGHQVGLAHACATEDEARACLDEWLRTHSETHLVAPRDASAAEKRLLQRRAA